jgi:hypothetical protein
MTATLHRQYQPASSHTQDRCPHNQLTTMPAKSMRRAYGIPKDGGSRELKSHQLHFADFTCWHL